MSAVQTLTQPAPAYACPIALVCPPIECHHHPGDRTEPRRGRRRGRCRLLLRRRLRPPVVAVPGT